MRFVQKLMMVGACALAGFSMVNVAQAHNGKVHVVTSFSVLEDLVKQVGGSYVEVKSLIPLDGDAHDFEPSPKDVRALSHAALFVVNGLGLDSWSQRLMRSSGYKGAYVVASDGVKPLYLNGVKDGVMMESDTKPAMDADHDHDHEDADHDHDHDHEHADADHDHDHEDADHDHDHEEGHEHGHHHHHHEGGIDPHAWQNVNNVIIYVQNIEKGLAKADPKHAAAYAKNAKAYIARLQQLNSWVKQQISSIPQDRRLLVTDHDAFGYFGHEYGITLYAAQGLGTEQEPSAKVVASLIQVIRTHKIPAIFLENIQNPQLLKNVAAQSGAVVGGTLYTDALSAEAPTYLQMMQHNVKTIVQGLTAGSK